MSDGLPSGVRRLLAGPIQSMEHLELLLLLARTEPRAWTAVDAASNLRCDATQTAARMRTLVDAGFVVETEPDGEAPQYAFGPTGKTTRADVQVLLEMYTARPVTLVRAVYDRRRYIADSIADIPIADE